MIWPLSKIFLGFWQIWRHQNDISKLTDLRSWSKPTNLVLICIHIFFLRSLQNIWKENQRFKTENFYFAYDRIFVQQSAGKSFDQSICIQYICLKTWVGLWQNFPDSIEIIQKLWPKFRLQKKMAFKYIGNLYSQADHLLDQWIELTSSLV